MKFEDTGLRDNETVKKAFELSLKYYEKQYTQELKYAMEDVDVQIDQHEEALKNQFPKSEWPKLKQQIEEDRTANKTRITQEVVKMRDQKFKENIVLPAKMIEALSDNASTELVSAIILLDLMKSPKDYHRLTDQFGLEIADLIAEYIDYEVYPNEKEQKVADMSSDGKRMALAVVIGSLVGIKELTKNVAPGNKVKLMGGSDSLEQTFKTANLVRGNDKKLDEKFVSIFNDLNKALGLGLSVSVKEDDTLSLTKQPVKPGSISPKFPGNPNVPPVPPAAGNAPGAGQGNGSKKPDGKGPVIGKRVF